ncbi:MAG TPA: DUF1552 domain-containing protein [Vicinamibacterales bacterium]|nr:DUF1552 domain-containing protein [Vicinamibacterales bacterium]
MFISKTAIPRRRVLRGMGAALALPLLDAMVPALTPTVKTAAAARKRLGCIYIPHGCIMDRWTPASEGAGFEFTPILKPLEPFRDSLVVVTNMTRPEQGVDTNHAGAPASWLAGVPPKRTAGPDYSLGITLDQLVARHIGQETTFPSLELATEDFSGLVGDCAPGFSCAYMNTLSWQSETAPLPMEINPRSVFEQLFGGGANRDERLARMRADRSLLDFVADDLKQVESGIGSRDRARLNQYLDHVREIERRIQRAERQAATIPDVPDAPVGVPESFEEHVKLLFDLLFVAYQADLTRVFTFMLGRELSQRTYPHIGVTEPHHSISHHGNRPAAIEMHAKVNTYHVSLFSQFIERLKVTEDGDGSLLDHSLILYGSGMGNGNVHSADLLPTLLVGSGGGTVKGNRHVVAGTLTPNADLLISIAETYGIELEKFGGNKGRISL